jgi:hypothetical protein
MERRRPRLVKGGKDKASLPPDVVAAMSAGRKIEAIKLLREAHGIGLKEAKAAVEAIDMPRTTQLGRVAEGGVVRTIAIAVAIAVALYLLFGA